MSASVSAHAAQRGGVIHRDRILDEVNRVDQHGLHALGGDDLPVRANLKRMVRSQRFRDRRAKTGIADVGRILMHRNAAAPADRMVLDRRQFDAVDQREHIRQIVMEMRD